MRVIAGTARGTKLEAPAGEDVTRPTIDRVKEGMFSSVQFLLPGAEVLDLFAGSGQLGIEALSRGAARCVLIDRSEIPIPVIKKNLKAAGLFSRAVVCRCEASEYLAHAGQSFDLVLLDPPFRYGTLQQILPAVGAVTRPGGTVLCESELDAVLPEEAGGLHLEKQYKYGTVRVTRYVKPAQGEMTL